MCARSAHATGRVLTSAKYGRGTRRLAQLPAEDSSASAIQLVRNVAGPLLHQLARMAGRLDPPAYLYLDGRGGQLTQPVDRFPLARLGFTIACWCVQCGRATHGGWQAPQLPDHLITSKQQLGGVGEAGSVWRRSGWKKRAWRSSWTATTAPSLNSASAPWASARCESTAKGGGTAGAGWSTSVGPLCGGHADERGCLMGPAGGSCVRALTTTRHPPRTRSLMVRKSVRTARAGTRSCTRTASSRRRSTSMALPCRP